MYCLLPGSCSIDVTCPGQFEVTQSHFISRTGCEKSRFGKLSATRPGHYQLRRIAFIKNYTPMFILIGANNNRHTEKYFLNLFLCVSDYC